MNAPKSHVQRNFVCFPYESFCHAPKLTHLVKDIIKLVYSRFDSRLTRIMLLIPPVSFIVFCVLAMIFIGQHFKTSLND